MEIDGGDTVNKRQSDILNCLIHEDTLLKRLFLWTIYIYQSTDDFKKSSVEFFIAYYNRWNLYLNGKIASSKKFEKFLI